MKHRIISEDNIGSHQFNIQIELIPNNDEEVQIIKKVESISASDEERQLIDNYLSFCLGERYSIVNLNWQKGNRFEIKAFKN